MNCLVDMYKFPAFRSQSFLTELVDSQYYHPQVLLDVDLTPEYMASNSMAALYVSKAAAAKEQIRRALFRHALFKIQNVEVTASRCDEDRILMDVAKVEDSKKLHAVVDKLFGNENQKLVREELWKVDRCGKVREYAVRYYREGDDGFSTKVVPYSWTDRIGLIRYYYS